MRFFLVVIALSASLRGEVLLTGKVTDENGTPVGEATISIREPSGKAAPLSAVSDPTGAFSVTLPEPGPYLVSVQRQGYYELADRPVEVHNNLEISLTLNPVREILQSVDVSGQPSPVDPTQTSHEQILTGTEINDIPFSNSHSLRNSMRMIPGVLQDQTGALHFNGAAENQVMYLLNGFNIGDPVTGRFNSQLAVEGIRELAFSSGRYSPEYGKGSAGVLNVRTDSGTDEFHYTATNFVPGVTTSHGIQLGNWTPRAGVSGPINAGRAWFADNFGMQYNPVYVEGLPPGQNTKTSWYGTNLLHAQVNLTPSNILFVDFLVNLSIQDNAGLTPIDPISTTTTERGNQYFGSIKDQIYVGGGVLVELGYAHNLYYDSTVPRGTAPYVIAPEGRSGNFFLTSHQQSSRDQFTAGSYLPPVHPFNKKWLGEHRFKVGVDLDRLGYSVTNQRTSFERLGFSGEPVSMTTFQGSGVFSRPNAESGSYFLDAWRVRKGLQVDWGVRQDWDELVRKVAISPRVAVAYSPFTSAHTRLSGGYAITYDATNLMLFAQPLDQQPVTTYYNPDGTVASTKVNTFVIDQPGLKPPRAANWTAGVDQEFPHHLYASLSLLRRRLSDGLTYVESPPGVFSLTNARRDSYDSASLVLRQTFAGGFGWMASYTRSRALSNAVFDLTVDQTTQVTNNLGPLPWDSPNRFLGTAYVKVPRTQNWAVAALVDWRSGFPFSALDQSGQVVGPVNAMRYPTNFDLNFHLERRFVFLNYRFAIRAGFNNITDHPNPTAVNNVVGGPEFGQFTGFEGRHFVMHIRFFGRNQAPAASDGNGKHSSNP